MRREDKAITDVNVINDILQKFEIIHIAVNDGETPYLFTVNFLYLNGVIYFHSANDGKKIELMKKNNKIIFQIEKYGGILRRDKACRWTSKYQSVVGLGGIEFIEDIDEKARIMSQFMLKFSKQEFKFIEEMVDFFDVIKINISDIKGKEITY